MKRLGEMFNVNTFIVSQVNPYVIPFLSADRGIQMENNAYKTFVEKIKALFANSIHYWFMTG